MSLKNLYIWLRYEKVWLFWCLQAISLVVVLYLALSLLMESALADAMGLTKMKMRVSAFREAMYWQCRVWKNASLPVQSPVRYYGFINKAEPDGQLLITVVENDKYVLREVTLANLTDIRVDGLAAAAAMRRRADAVFDIYPGKRAVVWIEGQPWNVMLISAKLARPTPAPPTNVVDKAFAEYFWAKVNGK